MVHPEDSIRVQEHNRRTTRFAGAHLVFRAKDKIEISPAPGLDILLIAELVILAPLHRDGAGWKWRWSNSIISTWKAAVYYFIILFSSFVLEPIFEEAIKNELKNFSLTYLLAPSTALLGFVWIWNVMIGKNINKTMALLLLTAAILIGIFVSANFEFISNLLNNMLGNNNE